jgi:translocation and assembly module TamA
LPARLFNALLFFAALYVGSAHALTVEVDAPDELKALLMQHLEAARAARLGEPLDEAELARLRSLSEETARELLATEGYFSPQVDSTLTRVADDWVMRYAVTPGPRTRVRTLKIEFTGALAEAGESRLRTRAERGFSLQPEMPFRQADWDAAKAALLRPLLTVRYPAARIAASEARIDPVTRSADLTLTLDSGPEFFYGQPVISGTQRYPASIVRNLSPLKPGQPYRQQDLLDYQMALDMSGYYAQATVRIEPDPALAAAVPIRVEVVERPEKLFSVGAGASTDTGARVSTSWMHRNISGRACVSSWTRVWKPSGRPGRQNWRGRAPPRATRTAWGCNSSRKTSKARKRAPRCWQASAPVRAGRSRRRCRCNTRPSSRKSAMW